MLDVTTNIDFTYLVSLYHEKQTFKTLYTNLLLICLCHLLRRITAFRHLTVTSQLHLILQTVITTAAIRDHNFGRAILQLPLDFRLRTLARRVAAGPRVAPAHRGRHQGGGGAPGARRRRGPRLQLHVVLVDVLRRFYDALGEV